jgi:hypothetical protein
MKYTLFILLLLSGITHAQRPKPYRNWRPGGTVTPPPSGTANPGKMVYGRIPLRAEWIFNHDYSTQNTGGFVDGSLTAEFVLGATDKGLIDKSTVTVAWPKSMSVIIDSVNYGDGAGSGSTMQAWTLNAADPRNKEAAFPFVGLGYNVWHRHKFSTPRRTDYYEFQRTYPLPTELVFWGWYYTQQVARYTVSQSVPIQNHLGANIYPWNLQKDSGGGLDSAKLAIAQTVQIYRNYIDYDISVRGNGSYAFQPADKGGWKLDSTFAWQKRNGKINMLCFKNNEPTPQYANLLTQASIRYGNNTSVSPSLVKVWTGPGYPENQARIGLGLVQYIQLGNEPNRWWMGKVGLGNIWTAEGHTTRYDSVARGQLPMSAITSPQGMMTPWELAFTSKIIADSIHKYNPDMKVVLAGLATSSAGYIRGVLQWCDVFNKGEVFFDGVSYHDYNNTAGMQNQSGVNVGVSPENTQYLAHIQGFRQALKDLAPTKNISLWITETGYSIQNPVNGNQNNVAKTITDGNGKVIRDRYQTQGDWSLRSSLVGLRGGLDGTMFYQLYDDTNFKFNPLGYLNWDLSCGIALEDSANNRTLRPTTAFFAQVNSFARDYVFNATLTDQATGVIVDKLTRPGAKPIYIVTKPTENASTVRYALRLPGVTSVTRYQLNDTGTVPTITTLSVKGGVLNVMASETPTFYLEH